MVTEKEITDAKKLYENGIVPYVNAVHKATEELDLKERELSQKFNTLVEQYNDEQLTDAHGQPVRVGSLLKKDNKHFIVIRRGMQAVNNKLMFNPQCVCRQAMANGNMLKRAPQITFLPEELKKLTIVKNSDLPNK